MNRPPRPPRGTGRLRFALGEGMLILFALGFVFLLARCFGT